jgi:tetratricopeptide (TPR) repeat protein
MILRNITAIACVSLLLASCGSEGTNDNQGRILSNAELSAQMVAQIDSLEAVFHTDTFNMNTEVGPLLLQKYTDYSRMFVGDKAKTPEYMYKSAAMSRGVGLPMKAIKLYDQILKEYPDYERCPEVAFLIGFTYDEDLKKPDLAKEAYTEVVNRFPTDHWAQQARYRLETIDMSDEELIEYFMKKNGENS